MILGLLICPLQVAAGNIVFSIGFAGDEIVITNTGSDSAYAMTAWTLNAAAQWQRVQVLSDNSTYLAPGQSLKGRRMALPSPTGLGRADPLLVLLHDQAGSRVAQLAWRQTPAVSQPGLPVQRQGALLSVAAEFSKPNKVIASYALLMPYEGIQSLENSFSANVTPPNPIRHMWVSDAPMVVNTHSGLGGAWLVHENSQGELSLQIVIGSVVRGQEQVPTWLAWARLYLMQLAAGMAAIAVLMMWSRPIFSTQKFLCRFSSLNSAGQSDGKQTELTPSKILKNSLIARRSLDLLIVIVSALGVASVLGIQFLLSHNLPTGGDSASHLLYVWLYTHELLPRGQITAWLPEVFGGFAFLSYYFPLSFISIAALAQVLPFAPAMKIGMFAAAMLLPGGVWLGSVYLMRLPRAVAIWGVLASLAFLLQEQNSIWGGNLLSTLAGEFAYSYGMVFSVLTLMAWQRCIATGRYWWLVALLEAATGFSHGFALLITGFATTAFLFDRAHFWRNLRLLALGHSLAFFLLAGWLWPMLQMHSLTIPNDALFEITRWQELLPQPMQPVLVAGMFAALLSIVLHYTHVLQSKEPYISKIIRTQKHAAFMASAALLAATGFLAGGSIGVANIRFFPFVWLLGGLACAWAWGALLLQIGVALPQPARWGWRLLLVAAALALAGWTAQQVVTAPDWGLWNHSGLEAKPQWQRLSQLFPALKGKLDSPRLSFEHDPANNDIGSTRALEALPMFLGGRPVLEGLYMESAPVGPAIYQLQSEVSTHPSSPLARFPSASLDLDSAAAHMNFLWANEVLIRHDDTLKAFAASPLFTEVASAAPFHVFSLKNFDTQWVDIVNPAQRTLHWMPVQDWMEASFAWFKSRERFSRELPVFHSGAAPQIVAPAASAQVHDLQLERQRLSWRTDAVGSAHLVRMAWHPRWQLLTKGQIYLAGPGFMLVVPQEADVVLAYGHTSIGIAGMVASVLALLVLLYLIWRDVAATRQTPMSRQSLANPLQGLVSPRYSPWPGHWLATLWPLLLVGAGLWFHLHNPERLYTVAWVQMRLNHFADAANGFDQAYAARKSNAKKEEALFWAAKAYEQAGDRTTALARYRQLGASFQGYWLPESLYSQWQLAQAAGDVAQAQKARARLLQEFPNDRWAQRALKESPP